MGGLYVKWQDPNAFPEGENPYVYGGKGTDVYGSVIAFVVRHDVTHAIIQPKHDPAHLIERRITDFEVVE